MRQVSAALRAAIDAGERAIKSRLTIDWDADGIQDLDDMSHQVGTISATQSLESSLPLQVQVVPGVAVAELDAQIIRGNQFRYAIPTTFRSLTSNSGAGVTTISVARPSTVREGDVILMAVFISTTFSIGAGSSFTSYDINHDTNVPWVVMAVRGDGVNFESSSFARVEGMLLMRRATASEPATYIINVPPISTAIYVAAVVNVGEQNIIGVTDYQTKGEDGTDTATSIIIPPVDVDLPGSTIVSFYAASSFLISGAAFSTTTSDDVKQVELASSASPSGGIANVRMAVMTTSDVDRGRYLKSANITNLGELIATLGFAVVLGPKLAGDEAQHAAWMMSELNQDSPYAGKLRIRRPMKWDLYFVTADGFESVPIFTGFSTTASADSRSRTATMKALDNRETLRGTKWGDSIIAETPEGQDSFTTLPFMPGLEATWVISYLLTFAFYRQQVNGVFSFDALNPLRSGEGYFAAPLPSRFTNTWIPMHGSLYPFVGALQNAYTQSYVGVRSRVQFSPGPFVAATKPAPIGGSVNGTWLASTGAGYGTDLWNVTNGQLGGRVQFWIKRGTNSGAVDISYADFQPGGTVTYTALTRIAASGAMSVVITQPAVSRTVNGPTVPGDDEWHFVGFHIDSVTGSARFRVDSTNTDVAMSTWANATPAVNFFGATVMRVVDGASISDLQIAGTYSVSTGQSIGPTVSATWANEDFTPTAFIDKSDNVLDCLPFIDDTEDTFSIIAAISEVESAAFFFDADGYPHYRTGRSNVTTTGQTVQKTITARSSLSDLKYESGVQQIANIVSVGYTAFLPVVDSDVYTASGVIAIPGNATFTGSVQLNGPTFGIPTITLAANLLANGTGTDMTALMNTGTTSRPYGVEFTVYNSSLQTVYLVDGSGQPSLTVRASYMAPSSTASLPVTVEDIASIRKYGEQALPTISGSPWMQREDSAGSYALTLLSDLADPKPVLIDVPIKGDPTLEFGDLVTIVDQNGLGVNGLYRITGKDPSHTPSDGFSQNLVVRQAATVAYWDTNSWDDGTVWG